MESSTRAFVKTDVALPILPNPAWLSLCSRAHTPVLQDTCLAETKSKALEDAMSVRQELQDQYQQQEQVALQVGRRCNPNKTSTFCRAAACEHR